MVPLFPEVTLMPLAVGHSWRRWSDWSAKLIVHPVSAIMQSSSERSWKGLELKSKGEELQVWWVLVERKGVWRQGVCRCRWLELRFVREEG